jgi:hypothetical protein
MKKFRKIIMVNLLILGTAVAANMPKASLNQVFLGIGYISNADRNQSTMIGIASAASDVCLKLALAGSGISGGASIAVGLVVAG